MTSASGSSNVIRTRTGSRYSIVPKVPRRLVASSMSVPMYGGVMMLDLDPRLGDGLDVAGSRQAGRVVDGDRRLGRWSSSTWYSTDGADAMRSRSNSRSRRSWMISMWSRPRKPQRKPKPSATELSG